MKFEKTFRKLSAGALFLFSAFLFSCSGGTSNNAGNDSLNTTTATTSAQRAEAVITGTYQDTTVSGNAVFTEDGGKVKLDLNLNIPQKANQTVAVHIHETGDCADTGMAAHGHWNPTNKQHGKWGEGEFHSGDIGNVQLDASGNGTFSMDTNLWTIGGDSTTNILNRAIIVHGGTDDYKTQPTGNAGNRIGCGVIK